VFIQKDKIRSEKGREEISEEEKGLQTFKMK